MKPLSEWTTEELHQKMKFGLAVMFPYYLGELLRRKERETIERCAAEVERFAGAASEVLPLADIIRGLQ